MNPTERRVLEKEGGISNTMMQTSLFLQAFCRVCDTRVDALCAQEGKVGCGPSSMGVRKGQHL